MNNLYYLAGLFDGEGTVCIRHHPRVNSYYVEMSLTNTYIPVVEWVKQEWGGIFGEEAAFQTKNWPIALDQMHSLNKRGRPIEHVGALP